MMNRVASLVLLLLAVVCSPIAIDAAAFMSSLVECSKIKKVTSTKNSTFSVCGTAYYETPSPAALFNGTMVYLGGYTNEYTITRGLRRDANVGDLTEDELQWAYVLDTKIRVRREDNNRCKVTVTVRGNTTVCNQCKFCGGVDYSVNCLNVVNGRKVQCESAATGKIYFPLNEAALRIVAPTAPTAPTPTATKKAPIGKVAAAAPAPRGRPPRQAAVPAPKAPTKQ